MSDETVIPSLHVKGNAKLLKTVFQLQNKMNTEIKLVFNGSSIDTRIVDPAHVCMVIQKIPVDSLEEYHNNQGSIELGLDTNKILGLFTGSLKNSDTISFDYDPVSDKLISQFRMFNRKTGLIGTENMPDPKTPNLDLPGTGIFDSKTLFEFLKQAEKISDHIAIVFTPEGAYFVAEGDTDKIKTFFPSDEIPEYICNQPLCSLFSVDYLYNVMYHMKNLHDVITLKINNDNPLYIKGNDLVETEVLLAPRIESDTYTSYKEYISDKPEEDQEETEDQEENTDQEPNPCDSCNEKETCDNDYEDCQYNPRNQEEDLFPDLVTPEETDQGYTQEDVDLIVNQEEETNDPELTGYCPECGREFVNGHCPVHINEYDPVPTKPDEPQQPEPNPVPQIKPSGDIIQNKDGTKTQMYTDDELEIAAKLQEAYQKRHHENIFQRCLKRLREQKQEQTTRNPEYQTDIDMNTVLDVIEDYDYTWNHETIGGC